MKNCGKHLSESIQSSKIAWEFLWKVVFHFSFFFHLGIVRHKVSLSCGAQWKEKDAWKTLSSPRRSCRGDATQKRLENFIQTETYTYILRRALCMMIWENLALEFHFLHMTLSRVQGVVDRINFPIKYLIFL